jgi:hypothetical protein
MLPWLGTSVAGSATAGTLIGRAPPGWRSSRGT